jgi:hypothetical protein
MKIIIVAHKLNGVNIAVIPTVFSALFTVNKGVINIPPRIINFKNKEPQAFPLPIEVAFQASIKKTTHTPNTPNKPPKIY